MRVLMISIDKGLVGGRPLGDVRQRHKKYGEFVDGLDIIVLSLSSYRVCELSNKVRAYPTNSWFKLFYYFDAIRIAKRLFKKIHYDLIVTQDPFITSMIGSRLKKIFGSKLLVHFHGDFPPVGIKNADGIRVMSQGQKERMIKAGVPDSKIRVISTPIDIEKFLNPQPLSSSPITMEDDHPSPPPPLERGGITTCPPFAFGEADGRREGEVEKRILYVGRLTKEKNIGLLIEAMAVIASEAKQTPEKKEIASSQTPRSDFKLQIIGSGPQEQALKAQAVGNDRIQFLGQIPAEKIPEIYALASMLVLPSNSESFGKVLIEANACRKPVVATTTTGAKEIVQDGYNGFLVPIGDAKALAEKILYLINNPEKAKEMGENGRKLVKEKYSDNTEKIIKFWDDIVNENLFV